MIPFWIPLLALIGLADSGYLLVKKLTHQKLVCFLGDDCDRVIKSKYGNTLKIPNEVFGIGFYLSVLFYFTLSTLGYVEFLGLPIKLHILFGSIPASLASLYLIGIQAFVLKEWCEYCLLSALVNFLIFGIALVLVAA